MPIPLENTGRFEGRPVTTLLPDGRRAKTLEPFAFIDSFSLKWDVPAGATVDGASIPRALWAFVGGPFEGKYRDASIIHDWYCDLRSRPWQTVHLMFYEAMLASSVPIAQAKLLYAGVLFGGPRWSQTVVENVSLQGEAYANNPPQADLRKLAGGLGRITDEARLSEVLKAIAGKHRLEDRPTTIVSSVGVSKRQVQSFRKLIDDHDPSIEEITQIVEGSRTHLISIYPQAETSIEE